MIQIGFLLADLHPAAPLIELDAADPRLEEAAVAAIGGNYARAAQVAEALYAAGVFDARVLGYLLYAPLIETGPAALGLVLRAAAKVVGDSRAAFTPSGRREILLDGALSWLLGKLVRELERGEQLKDELWHRFRAAIRDGSLADAPPAAEALQPLLGALLPRSRAQLPLLHLIDLLRQLQVHGAEPASESSVNIQLKPTFSSATTLEAKLGGEPEPKADPDDDPDFQQLVDPNAKAPPADPTAASATRRRDSSEPPDHAAESAPFVDAEEDEKKESIEDVEDVENVEDAEDTPRAAKKGRAFYRSSRTAAAKKAAQDQPERHPRLRAPEPPQLLPAGFVAPAAIRASAPLQQLARQIQGFAALVEQESYLHAAVVADELQRAIDSFDPRVYLPALLIPYFRTLAQCSAKLAPILEQRTDLTFRALRQLYQVDPNTFTAGMNPPARPGGHRSAGEDELDDEDER